MDRDEYLNFIEYQPHARLRRKNALERIGRKEYVRRLFANKALERAPRMISPNDKQSTVSFETEMEALTHFLNTNPLLNPPLNKK